MSIAKFILGLVLTCPVIAFNANGPSETAGNVAWNETAGNVASNETAGNVESNEISLFTSEIASEVLPNRTTTIESNASADDLVDLDELLEVWNPKTAARLWTNESSEEAEVSFDCASNVTSFLRAVSLGAKWALKMIDASGRYRSGVFSGNRYWIGATDQCREMEKEYIEWRRSGIAPSADQVPPFRVSVNAVHFTFEILTLGLNDTYNITAGLCLPSSCDTRDVARLVGFVIRHARSDLPRRISITEIRNLSEGYTPWQDKAFYIVLITFVVVAVLVVLGTSYDVALRYQVLRREEKERNNGISVTELKILRPAGDMNDEITISRLWSVKTHNGSIDVRNSKDDPKPLSEAFLSFSLLLNVSKLNSLDVGYDTLAPIHGLRFISMLWVIMVHTCLIFNEVSDNNTFRKNAENDFLYQTISNGSYAVDTFLLISGCLVSFLYFRTIAKERMQEMKIVRGSIGRFYQFLGMMWYRYFRLTPPYLLFIGLAQVSAKWYHDHSIIKLTSMDHVSCEKYWWRNALYINTYYKASNEVCITWSWYLANDTQFYTVGIIILIIAARYLRVGIVITSLFLLSSWITTAIITLNTEHIPSIQDPFAHYASLYDKPWTRIGPYLIGMATGWYLFKVNCKVNMNKATVGVGWTLSTITMVSIVYGLYGTKFGPVLSAMYTALSHSGWAISVAWVLVACVTGHGGIVNKLLSWKYIYPVSRLTYCTYLVHPALIRAVIYRGESSIHLTRSLMAILFFGITVASYFFSLILSLLFEAPMVSLLRIVHPLRRWKRE